MSHSLRQFEHDVIRRLVARAPAARRSASQLFGFAVLLLGCSSLSRVDECKVVVSLVNESLDQIASLQPDAGPKGAKQYEAIAERYEELEQSLRGLAILDRDLRRAVVAYAAIPEKAALRSRAYAKQLAKRRRAKNSKKRRREQKKLTGIEQSAQADLRRETAAIRHLNDICRPR